MQTTRKLLLEPWKALFYAYFYFMSWLRSSGNVIHVLGGPHTRPYLTWKIFRLCGLLELRSEGWPSYYHDDSTTSQGHPGAINGRCTDISKSRVEQVFAEVFGYGTLVDPSKHHGPMVEKSEINAAHDGRIVEGPTEAKPGKVYQRLIDNSAGADHVLDLRPCIVGNQIPFVYKKVRPLSSRFSNDNTRITYCRANDVFSDDEQGKLVRFAKLIGLDIGELDVLRDKDGRLYVVDVAKTPHSPGDKAVGLRGIICMHRAAAAFRSEFLQQPITSTPPVMRT